MLCPTVQYGGMKPASSLGRPSVDGPGMLAIGSDCGGQMTMESFDFGGGKVN